MSRLILFLALLILAALIYRSIRRQKKPSTTQRKRIVSKNMVQCDYCGLHVTEQEVLRYQGRNYCSEEHRLLDQSQD